MSLPKGFGDDWEIPEPPRKCKFGNVCYKSFMNQCKIHKFYNNYFGLIILVASAVGFTAFLLTILVIYDASVKPIEQDLNGFSCAQLAEYIADKSPQYQYAEHRFQWLCVNNKSQEFQN